MAAAGPPRPGPEGPGQGGVLLAQVAGQDPSVLGQRQGHREGAVAREDPDLQGAPGAEELDQQLHQLALLRGDLHVPHGVGRGGPAQGLLLRMLPQGDAQEVGAESVVEG